MVVKKPKKKGSEASLSEQKSIIQTSTSMMHGLARLLLRVFTQQGSTGVNSLAAAVGLWQASMSATKCMLCC